MEPVPTPTIKHRIKGTVSSSEQSTAQLKSHGIEVMELNHTGNLSLYVDGADECDGNKCLIKGGGAALTREKIIAEASERFVCIIDPSKQVPVLGRFPLPVEVIPMARSLIARRILDMTGGQPAWREGVITDNGNAAASSSTAAASSSSTAAAASASTSATGIASTAAVESAATVA